MNRRLLLTLSFLAACGTNSPATPEQEFFEPKTYGEDEPSLPTPDEGATPEFSWWQADREVVLHPLESSLSEDPIFWDLYGMFENYDRETFRKINERNTASPLIHMYNIGLEASVVAALAEDRGVSVDELSGDRWIAFQTSFNEKMHIFQIPDGIAAPRVVYETPNFVITGLPGHLTLILDPQSIRNGIYGQIPMQFQPLFDIPASHAMKTEVTFLYPSFHIAQSRDFYIANYGVEIHLTMVPIIPPYTERFQEVQW